jgi:hypothetical protein
MSTAGVRLNDWKYANTKIRLLCGAGDDHIGVRAVGHIDISNVPEIGCGVKKGCGYFIILLNR